MFEIIYFKMLVSIRCSVAHRRHKGYDGGYQSFENFKINSLSFEKKIACNSFCKKKKKKLINLQYQHLYA